MKHEIGENSNKEPMRKKAKSLPLKSNEPLEILTNPDEPFSQSDVVYYQKEAIFRQWNIQFSKNKRLEVKFNHLKLKYDNIFSYYQILTKWWNQLVENLKLVSNETVQNGFNDDILIPIEMAMNSKCDDQTINDLNLIRDELIKLISPLFQSINHHQLNGNDEQIIQLNKSISNLNIIKDKLINENDDLKSNLNDLNNQVDQLIKKIDRQNSSTLNRLKVAAINEDDESRESSVKIENQKQSSDKSTLTSTSTTVQQQQGQQQGQQQINDQTIHELEDLKIKLSEFEGRISFLNQCIDEKVSKITELENKLNDQIQTPNSNQPQQQLVKESSNDDQLNNKIFELENSKKKLEVQMFELESNLTKQKNKFEEKAKFEIEQSNSLIKKLEQDVNRLRTERDSSITKLNILKSEKGSNELIENYQNLIKTLQDRLDSFENQRDINFNNISNDDLNKLLTDELKQMEIAFKKTREISINKLNELKDYQIIINKLQIEKTKADEKYFQAMRTNDSISNQNKILQSNLNKQMELIEILRDEDKGLKKKLEIENKLFDKLNSIEKIFMNELMKFKSKFEKAEKAAIYESNKSKTFQNDISNLKSENNQLKKNLTSLNEELNGSKSKSSKLEILVNKYRTNSRTEEDEEINQALLNMTKCQLCTKNFKDIALKTCGHCFCKSCVDDRLNSRMRKCPNCNSQFSRYDLLNIHL